MQYGQPLISVIIPCYNAERWVAEAVRSCLDQTYAPIEVILIDDGSTDTSLQVLKQFGDSIKIESGPNRGGNHARNRGIKLSSGDYIQFLDADDYILPDKIERQVAYLHETKADAVYGDWRYQYHAVDGTVTLGDIVASREQEDVLESLLQGWNPHTHPTLYRRDTVVNSGGWDENLRAAQEWDFNISMALRGARYKYQPGCGSIYRKHQGSTVSSANLMRMWRSCFFVLEKAETTLRESNRLTASCSIALAERYFSIGRFGYDEDISFYQDCLKKVLSLHPTFRPQESGIYNAVQKVFGFHKAEHFAAWKRRVARRLIMNQG